MNELESVLYRQLTNRCPSTRVVVESGHSTICDGDGLFLKQSSSVVEEGSFVFEEYPVGGTAIAYFSVDKNGYCSNCVRQIPPESTLRVHCVCGETYCSSMCQERAHELYHRILCGSKNPTWNLFCSAAAELNNEFYIVAARLFVMVPSAPWIFHYHAGLTDNATEVDPGDTARMADMFIHVLTEAGVDRDKHCSKDVFSQTIGMLHVNSLSLRWEDDNVGFALYPTQSLMNHSTTPNCRCVSVSGDDTPTHPCLCAVQAMRDIQPGEELTIDYISGHEKVERAAVLLEQYGITENFTRRSDSINEN